MSGEGLYIVRGIRVAGGNCSLEVFNRVRSAAVRAKGPSVFAWEGDARR